MERKKLKEWAKNAFYRSYWKSVLVSLISVVTTFIVTYIITYGLSLLLGFGTSFGILGIIGFLTNEWDEEGLVVMGIVGAFVLIFSMEMMVVGTALKGFLTNPLEIGCKKYWCAGLYEKEPKLKALGAGFSKHYGNMAKVMFVRDIILGLWITLSMTVYMVVGMAIAYGGVALLAIYEDSMSEVAFILWTILLVLVVYIVYFATCIPAYIKVLQYLFVPYILAEHPDMPRNQVFALAKQMVKGNKWKIFVMNLSFMGWLLLSMCTCGILQIFYVGPYIEYTITAYYKALKQNLEGQSCPL